MKKLSRIILVVFLVGSLITTNGLAQENQKLAQTGFQFLSVVSDARAAAMGEAMTSLQTSSSSMFFNPAGMAEMKNMVDVTASVNQWIADIKHYSFSVAVSPAGGRYGVIGFSVQSVNYGDFYGTVVDKSTDLGYRDVGIFKLNALAVGVGYAKQLTDRFSIGGQIRWARQDLGESTIPLINPGVDTTGQTVTNKLTPLVFDFGTQFKTGIKSLVFGMSVRNFSKEIKYVSEGFQTPLVFNLGISMNVLDFAGDVGYDQQLLMSVDASHYRDHPEQVKVGLEYQFMKVIALRGGYVLKSSYDESAFSFGLGISYFGFAFDYAYTPFGVFDKVQRMTARFSL
jgi:hypothetical protein